MKNILTCTAVSLIYNIVANTSIHASSSPESILKQVNIDSKIHLASNTYEKKKKELLVANELILENRSCADSKINALAANTISNIGEYAFELAKVGNIFANKILTINRNAFARNRYINTLYCKELVELSTDALNNTQIGAIIFKKVKYISEKMFARAMIGSLDIGEIQNLSAAKDAFWEMTGMEHLGFPFQEYMSINPNCFKGCDLSSLRNMTVYYKQNSKLNSFHQILKSGGLEEGQLSDKFNSLNLVVAPRMNLEIDLKDFIRDACNELAKEGIFKNINTLNIFLDSLSFSKNQLDNTEFKGKLKIELYSGLPSAYSGNPKDLPNDIKYRNQYEEISGSGQLLTSLSEE